MLNISINIQSINANVMLNVLTRFKYTKHVALRYTSTKTMKYLNVAEKNDAAKNIASILSRGASNRREGFSKFNKIYEFNTTVLGEPAQMTMTSVSGHLLNYGFVSTHSNWNSCNPISLFDAQVIKNCPDNYKNIKRTLEREIRTCNGLIIWTDCDREGENIGFEIIKVCTDIKPHLRIYRAKFSEITGPSIFRALNTLGQPNQNVSDAVDVRQELDLRTGAAFTRLQTLRLQKVFPQKLADKLISYGSCQFPTLGFVVERYQAIEEFVKETFWRIKMTHTVKTLTTEFTWARERLFDKNACQAILDICKENPQATVEKVDTKEKSKWRPLPLDTIEMEKTISRKLKINAKETMKIAERLYTQGFISYPRTETNIFPKEINLTNLVEMQRDDTGWGPFAHRIMNEGGPNPRHGKKSDQAHPPIHPTKYTNTLQGNEKRVYEFIVRHFLACVHKDAKGFETIVVADIADEKFTAKGLVILEKNYLDVYVYDKWSGKEINNYQVGDQFMPTVLEMAEGSTSPPKLLTEADLIALMEKHGIGTDATHAEHIDTIKQREYVGLHENIYFLPGTLGMGLVEGYNNIGLEVSLAKPNLRAEFESELKLVCDGLKNADTVRQEQIAKYRQVFQQVVERIQTIDEKLGNRLDDRPQQIQDDLFTNANNDAPVVMKCPKCGNDMILRSRKEGTGKFLSCIAYPDCKHSIWFPSLVETVEVTGETCTTCGPNNKMLKIKFKQNPFVGYPNPNKFCLGGCDQEIFEVIDVRNSANTRTTQPPNNRTANPAVRAPPAPPRNINRRNTSLNTTIATPPQQANRPQFTLTNNAPNDPNNEICCSCNNPARELSVRKDGPNKGRKFHKCATDTCKFFSWVPDDQIATSSSNNMPPPPPPPGGGVASSDGEVKCNCNQKAVQRQVVKQGPNTGKYFYACPKGPQQGCNFFQWCDGDGSSGSSGFNGARPKTTKRNATSTNNGPKAKRKCSNCKQEGHTRTKCPQL